MLLRFAGPRLAASDVSRSEEHPLMPVRLRAGGRTVGGAMSWGEPKSLAPFPDQSPFFGLPIPEDVTITAQAMPKPDPPLADPVPAPLTAGTVLGSAGRRGSPASFGVTPVIAGWTEALQLMPVGSKWKLFIPQDLADGANPRPGGPIEPFMVLVFEVELLSAS